MFAKSPWMLALACCLGWAGLAQALDTQRWQTPQGAQVVFVPSRDNPLLDVRVDFDAGNRRDNASKPGVSDLTLSMLDAGTARLSEEAIKTRLADLAAQLNGSSDIERAGISLRVLSDPAQRDPALALLSVAFVDVWKGVGLATIIFIAGMMIMVEGLGKSGFFRWLCLSLAKATHYHVVPLLVCFMAMAAFLAMFIDSITVVLFLATVTLELAQILCFDPVPMILSEVFCANLGGAATMCGDPPNIIIGTALGYTFTDFIKNTGVIIGMVIWMARCTTLAPSMRAAS